MAFFDIITENGTRILTDPIITGGTHPEWPNIFSPVKSIDEIDPPPDLVLATHGSSDHGTYEIPEIVKKTGAKLVCGYDNAANAMREGVKPEQIFTICPGNVYDFRGIKIRSMGALHGSWITLPEAAKYPDARGYLSYEPMGFMIHTESDFRIYDMGDTSITKDLEIYGNLYRPDLLLAPIGRSETHQGLPQLYYNEAALVTYWISPEIVIPMHYDPPRAELAEKFAECIELLNLPVKCVILKVGENIRDRQESNLPKAVSTGQNSSSSLPIR